MEHVSHAAHSAIATIAAARNRHMVDQLADVRAKIKELQGEESALKAQISAAMGSADSLGGDQFVAFQRVSERKGAIDEARIKAAGLDPDALRKPAVTVYSLVVEPRVSEAAE